MVLGFPFWGRDTPSRGAGMMPGGHAGPTKAAEHPLEHPAEPSTQTGAPQNLHEPRLEWDVVPEFAEGTSGCLGGGHRCASSAGSATAFPSPLLQQQPPNTRAAGALPIPANLPVLRLQGMQRAAASPSGCGRQQHGPGGLCPMGATPQPPLPRAAAQPPTNCGGLEEQQSRLLIPESRQFLSLCAARSPRGDTAAARGAGGSASPSETPPSIKTPVKG